MSELAQALLAASQAETPDRESLTDDQIVNRLREVFALRGEGYEFEPGDIILHKFPALAEIRDADQPHVFIEYLPEPLNGFEFAPNSYDLFGSSSGVKADCRVGYISDGAFHIVITDSRNFRPHPDFATEGKEPVQ